MFYNLYKKCHAEIGTKLRDMNRYVHKVEESWKREAPDKKRETNFDKYNKSEK